MRRSRAEALALKHLMTLLLIVAVVVALTSIAAESVSSRSGARIYQDFCSNCHSAGWQGAPVAYDAHDWAPRAKQGIDVLVAHAKDGINSMPPMGTCMNCTDAELRAAIEEMMKF